MGGTGRLLQGEVFPTTVRGQAAATGATVDWLANFALIVVLPTWELGIGLSWITVCFAALCLCAVAFVRQFLPETKGRPVAEITELSEEQAGARRTTVTA